MAHQPLHQMTFLQSPSLSVETEKMLKLRFAILKSIKIRYIHRAKPTTTIIVITSSRKKNT